MKITNAILFLSVFSFNVNAAFTEAEIKQLEEINKSSVVKKERAKAALGATTEKTIAHFPEQSASITALKKSWEETIKKKCRLLTSASRNSDAEIAAENLCLAKEYAKAATFFDELNY